MHRFCLFLLSIMIGSSLAAKVITLRSGQTIQGTIIVHNEEVLILRTPAGVRYQYPANEVVSIAEDTDITPVEDTLATESRPIKPVAIRFTFSAGPSVLPQHGTAGAFGANVAIGTRNLGKRRIFLGGSVGYQGCFFPTTDAQPSAKAHFIPLQAVVSVPLLPTRHAPELGAGLGYGFATQKGKSGLVAHIDLSYRYQATERTALMVGLTTRFQQSHADIIEIINQTEYIRSVGCVYILPAAYLAIQL